MPTSLIEHRVTRGGEPFARSVAAAALMLYLGVTIFALGRFPIVGQDEPWIAAPAYKLANEGTLGSDLFTGYHGMERHHFVHMPMYALLEAVVFRTVGVGVAQMRALSALFGLALLLGVYAVGRRVGGEWVASLAVVLMVVQRLTVPTEVRRIGILLLDSARINRYDIAVPAFGLAALWVAIRAIESHRDRLAVLAGVLAGFSALSHLYGIFWVPSLVVLLVVEKGARRALAPVTVLSIGFVLAAAPWFVWIASNWRDYLAQMQTVSHRFDVLVPAFYTANIVHADNPISFEWTARTLRTLPVERLGSWTLAIGAPAAFYMMWRRGLTRTVGQTALLVSGIVQFVLFVALLQVKTLDYVIALWPLGALALAWLGVELWNRRALAIRIALALIAAGVVVEGALRVLVLPAEASATSSYDDYEQRIARCIPDGSLVVGFQHYWLGLRQFQYRTWLLPLDLANPYVERDPMTLDAALDRLNPDVILIDSHALELFADTANPSHAYHHVATGFQAFRARRPLTPLCEIQDPSYGTMEVYRVGGSRPKP